MAYNTKAIKTDVDKKPIPQYYNPVMDEYEVLQGANGATRHILYGPDGNPISTAGDKLAVRASEIETQLTAIQGYIDGLEPAIGTPAADPAANTMLARLKTLATLIGEVQATPTANTLLARLKALETKIDAIIAGTTPATVQVSGSKMKLYGATISDRPDATTVPIGATFTIVDATQEFNSWISDGTSWGEEI